LQSLPANVLRPEDLAERAREIAAAHETVSVEVLGREEIVERGMGGLAAVASGSHAEPCLIALRYTGGGQETVGLVGKGVTFDSGGISIKPAGGMQEMKMDMSGAAAVLEGFAAIAELELKVDLVAVVPATENMPSGHSMRPGDIITQLNGKTVEVNNTDAEGRLILADALTYCVRDMEADRVIDLATLTGAVLVALGSTYAALISNDDDWAARVGVAADATGELAWRLPLHAEYKELTKGKVADLTNAASKRKAGTIYAASFLEEFVGGKPWVHLDIAGTSWDVGREYVGNGPTGYGVRLLVALARELAA
jgi:leucyl aminopeptidase